MKKLLTSLLVAAALLCGCTKSDPTLFQAGLFELHPPPTYPVIEGSVSNTEAAALAFLDAGVTQLPVTPAPDVLKVADAVAKYALNCVVREDDPSTALALTLGASMFGRRAALVLTDRQFAQIAGELGESALLEWQGNVVILVLADRNARNSSVVLRMEPIINATQLPNIVSSGKRLYGDIIDGFQTSDYHKLPFIILLDADLLDQPTLYDRTKMIAPRPSFERNMSANVLSPALAGYQRRRLVARQGGDASIVRPLGAVDIREVLPERFEGRFGFYAPAMAVMATMRNELPFVAGEGDALGFFAFPPFEIVDAVAFPGSAIPLAQRAAESGYLPAWAVMDDGAFFAHGLAGIAAARNGGVPVNILVFNTFIDSDPILFEALLGAFGDNVTRINASAPTDELKTALRAAGASADIEIVVVDYVSDEEE